MLCLGSGAPGCGKSSQHKFLATILPDAIYLSMEYKDIEMLEKSKINFVIIEKFGEDYLEDPIATIAELERNVYDVIHSGKYKNVIVDGVSDIRRFAKAEWIYKDNLNRKKHGEKPRDGISGENKAAWAAINDRTKSLLRPLINWANVTRNNVFFTAQLKDNYLNDKKIGKAIDIGDWCEYDVDVKMDFLHPSLDTFIIRFTKLPDWAIDNGTYEVTVQKNGLLALMAERGLILKKKEE